MMNNNIASERTRNFGIDILRILVMFLIVSCHACAHSHGGKMTIFTNEVSINYIVIVLTGIWGSMSNIVFMIITSWFMCDRDRINVKRWLYIVIKTWILCAIVIVFTYIRSGTINNSNILIREILIPWSQYGFLRNWLLFYLILPILHCSIRNMSDKNLKKVVVLLCVIVPTFNIITTSTGGELAMFVTTYYTVAYLKRHPQNIMERYKAFFPLIMLCVSCVILVCRVLVKNNDIFLKIYVRVINENIITMVVAIMMFYSFKNIKLTLSERIRNVISCISGATFGVYILHVNLLLSGNGSNEVSMLWDDILHITNWYQSPMFCIYFFASILIVYISCTLIDLIRKIVIEVFILEKLRFINGFCERISSYYSL